MTVIADNGAVREFFVGDVVRHFKGNEYVIENFAKHSETGEMLVVYAKFLDCSEFYARPLCMFASLTDKEKYPNVEQKYRFETVDHVSLMTVLDGCPIEQ